MSAPCLFFDMNKYYIKCGDIKKLLLAESPEEACFKLFSSIPEIPNRNSLSEKIRLSQKGHGEHSDDLILSLPDMFCLWLISMDRKRK